VQILRPDPVHPTRKRLWQAVLAIGTVVLIITGTAAISRNTNGSHRLSLGEDFLPVYAAGILIRDGHANELYAMEPLARIERDVVAKADLDPLPSYGPFLNPPFFAAFYVPFAKLPYRQSLAIWLGLNLLLLCGSAILLCRMLVPSLTPTGRSAACGFADRVTSQILETATRLSSSKSSGGSAHLRENVAGLWQTRSTWGLVPLLLVLPLPFWEAMYHQQNSFLSLFILCAIVTVWRADIPREVSALVGGLFAGLLFYKPQLALAVAAVLVVTRGGWVLAGLAITGATFSIFTLFKMPGTSEAFLHALPPTIHWMRTARAYNWGRQVTPQSFWRLLLQGKAIGETDPFPRLLALITAVAFGLALAAVVLRFAKRWSPGAASLDRLISATIVSMPLIMPYYMDYDLMLFAIPAVLQSADWIRTPGPKSRSDRWLLAAWVMLFIEFYGNPGLANHMRLNLAVPLIGLLAGLSIVRCMRAQVASEPRQRYDAPALAAAA
jgi:hypothetical protein